MHVITMHLYSLEPDFNVGDELREDVTVSIDETEEARMAAVRKLLGGEEDAMAGVEKHPAVRLFRRLDAAAPGGIGYMVAAQLHDTQGNIIMPVPLRRRDAAS